MIIYLAGTASAGNAGSIWRDNSQTPQKAMDIFLAGTYSRSYLATPAKIAVLESFYYILEWMIPYIQNHWHFMLDSGAFTFMGDPSNSSGVDWDEYLDQYIKFINRVGIDLFLELDIDNVVGIEEVERLRTRLEEGTGKQCIPVWHKDRGLDYWYQMCREYDYVAIGGIVTGEISRTEYKHFPSLLDIAREHNTKVHGLGFTNLSGLTKYPFYSVDSTAWLYGNRGGFVYEFNGETIIKHYPHDDQVLESRKAAIHNFKEWLKFQRYAKENL